MLQLNANVLIERHALSVLALIFFLPAANFLSEQLSIQMLQTIYF
jgi:hypothetical protein